MHVEAFQENIKLKIPNSGDGVDCEPVAKGTAEITIMAIAIMVAIWLKTIGVSGCILGKLFEITSVGLQPLLNSWLVYFQSGIFKDLGFSPIVPKIY